MLLSLSPILPLLISFPLFLIFLPRSPLSFHLVLHWDRCTFWCHHKYINSIRDITAIVDVTNIGILNLLQIQVFIQFFVEWETSFRNIFVWDYFSERLARVLSSSYMFFLKTIICRQIDIYQHYTTVKSIAVDL